MTAARCLSDVCSDFEPEFIEFVSQQAESDADAVAIYLQDHGVRPRAADGSWQPCALPGTWLLAFALVLRLRYWELHHIRHHLDAGMLSAVETKEKLASLMFDQVSLQDYVNSLWRQVLALYHSSFLWCATVGELRAQIAIIEQEDEAFLDQVAEFLLHQVRNQTN